MKKAITSKAISIFLAVLMAVTGILPATAAFAGDGVDGKYDLQLFYDSTNTAVPKTDEDGSEHKEYMYEGDELQLKYKIMNGTFPNNGYVNGIRMCLLWRMWTRRVRLKRSTRQRVL